MAIRDGATLPAHDVDLFPFDVRDQHAGRYAQLHAAKQLSRVAARNRRKGDQSIGRHSRDNALAPVVRQAPHIIADDLWRMRRTPVYVIGKRGSYIMVAQLSPEVTARLVDRWQKLETAASQRRNRTFQTLPLMMYRRPTIPNTTLGATVENSPPRSLQAVSLGRAVENPDSGCRVSTPATRRRAGVVPPLLRQISSQQLDRFVVTYCHIINWCNGTLFWSWE